MRWLFVPQLRPFVLLAGAASLVLNVALLAPALYMAQVFDRVFSSRSVETLVMLSAIGALALALGYCMDAARSRALGWAGRALDRRMSPAALASNLRHAANMAGRAESDTLRDIAQLRNFLGGSGIHALFDAPWLPVYLLVIFAMHPVLGWTAAIGACLLAGLGVLTERLTHEHAERALQRSRRADRHAEALTRNAEVIVGMGMTSAAVNAWRARQEELLQAQTQLGGRTSRLAALARMLRQGLQVTTLGIGAWLVIGDHASQGIMVAATILLGRALQPAEHLISGWKAHVEAHGAWARLSERSALRSADTGLALPAPSGRLELERVVFGAARGRPAIIKGVTLALQAGESLGVVGPSGSGKTTLIRLILGILQPQGGAVRLDGADIAGWDRDALGQYIGYLPQDVELFAGTVAENIARLGPVDSARVVAAAQLAHAHDMILRLPAGYDTPIGEARRGAVRRAASAYRARPRTPRLAAACRPR